MVLFRPAKDELVESLSAGEVFESEVNFVEFDSQRVIVIKSCRHRNA